MRQFKVAEIIWLESRVKDLFGESCQRWNGWKYKIVNFWVISFLALAGRSSENENDPWSTAFITRVKNFTYFVHNAHTLSQNYIVSLGQRRSRALRKLNTMHWWWSYKSKKDQIYAIFSTKQGIQRIIFLNLIPLNLSLAQLYVVKLYCDF